MTALSAETCPHCNVTSDRGQHDFSCSVLRFYGDPDPAVLLALASTTPPVLARVLGVAPKTVYRWRAGDTLPEVKRAWLERWNRSTVEVRAGLIAWSNL